MREAYDFTHGARRRRLHGRPVRRSPTFEMTHVGVHAMGFRIEAGGGVLAYTGDTGPCDAVVEMSRGADVLMAEATYQNANNLMPVPHVARRRPASTRPRAGVPARDPHAPRARTRSRGVAAEAAAVFERVTDVAFSGHDDRDRRMTRPDGRALGRAASGHAGSSGSRSGRRAPCCSRWARPACWWRPRSRRRRRGGCRGTGKGWVTGEYSMLPGRHERAVAARGEPRPAGRAHAGDPAADRPVAPQRDGSRRGWASARSRSTATCSRPTPARARRRSPAATSRWPSRCGGLAAKGVVPDDVLPDSVAAVSVGIVDGEARLGPVLRGGRERPRSTSTW